MTLPEALREALDERIETQDRHGNIRLALPGPDRKRQRARAMAAALRWAIGYCAEETVPYVALVMDALDAEATK